MKKLRLNVSKKWFDGIKTGKGMPDGKRKLEEYREIKPFYISLFFDWKDSGLTRDEFCKCLEEEGDRSLVVLLCLDCSHLLLLHHSPPILQSLLAHL